MPQSTERAFSTAVLRNRMSEDQSDLASEVEELKRQVAKLTSLIESMNKDQDDRD